MFEDDEFLSQCHTFHSPHRRAHIFVLQNLRCSLSLPQTLTVNTTLLPLQTGLHLDLAVRRPSALAKTIHQRHLEAANRSSKDETRLTLSDSTYGPTAGPEARTIDHDIQKEIDLPGVKRGNED